MSEVVSPGMGPQLSVFREVMGKKKNRRSRRQGGKHQGREVTGVTCLS